MFLYVAKITMAVVLNSLYSVQLIAEPKCFFSFFQQTPMHTAAREGHEYTVKSLVKQGADTSIKDTDDVSMTLLKVDL